MIPAFNAAGQLIYPNYDTSMLTLRSSVFLNLRYSCRASQRRLHEYLW